MDFNAREALIARFAAYLDGAGGQAGDDAADPPAPDLYTLLAELGALKGEIRLESRQVKEALDGFRDAFELVRTAQSRLEGEQARRAEAERRTAQDADRALLLEFLELRDRLQAGEDQARRYRPGWLARRGGADTFVSGMADGLAISLRRLDETLARRNVRPLQCIGARFDPQTMHAAEVLQDPKRPDGTVLSELRRGYFQGDRLLRPAEVTVNRLASGE